DGTLRSATLSATPRSSSMEQTHTPPPPYASETLLRLQTPDCPEDRLMLAVLLDGVGGLREHPPGCPPPASRLVASTGKWFTSPDESWPLSFVNVCHTLGLDPAVIRDGLRRELAELGARGL